MAYFMHVGASDIQDDRWTFVKFILEKNAFRASDGCTCWTCAQACNLNRGSSIVRALHRWSEGLRIRSLSGVQKSFFWSISFTNVHLPISLLHIFKVIRPLLYHKWVRNEVMNDRMRNETVKFVTNTRDSLDSSVYTGAHFVSEGL